MLSQKLLPRGTTVAYLHRDIWIWETTSFVGLPRWCTGKESNCQRRRHRRHRLDPWNRKWQPISVFLLWLSHGQRSPAGYSPWGHRVGQNWETAHHHCWACVYYFQSVYIITSLNHLSFHTKWWPQCTPWCLSLSRTIVQQMSILGFHLHFE